MTKENQEKCDDAQRLTENEAISWIKQNPEAVRKYPELFSPGNAFAVENVVYLQEKRVQILRKKNLRLRKKLESWADLANANQKMFFCLLAIAGNLLKETQRELKERTGDETRALVTSQICASVFNKFLPDLRCSICWLDSDNNSEAHTINLERSINADDARISGLLRRLFSDRNASCEHLNDAQKILFFGKPINNIASTALVPVMRPDKKTPVAALALCSSDPNRFVPGMGSIFLTQLANLIGIAAPTNTEK